MPEWTENKNAGSFDISEPSSPESTASSRAPEARLLPPTPPPRPAAAETKVEPPPSPKTSAPTSAPPSAPPSASNSAREAKVSRPQLPARRPSLMVRTPSYESATRPAVGTPPTGPEPSPAERFVVPAEQPGQTTPSQEDSGHKRPTAATKTWPAASPVPAGAAVKTSGGWAAGSKDVKSIATVAPPPSATKVSRASPMVPKGKGTPARRGKQRKSTATTGSEGTPGGGSGSRRAAGAASRPSPSMAASRPSPSMAAAPAAGAVGKPSPALSGKPRTSTNSPAPPVGSQARRLLEVEVVEASGLLGVEKGGVSNPCAKILLVDLGGRAVKAEGVQKTSVVKSTNTPVWNHKVTFGHRTNLSSPPGGNMPTLRLQVYSVGRFGSERALGMVDIPLVHLSKDGEEGEQYHSLEPFEKMTSGSRLGDIHVRLKIGAVVQKRDASSKLFADLNRGIDDRGDEEPGYLDQAPNFLRIKLHQAQELLPMDVGATSDPLVIFRLGGKEKRSSVVKLNLNPQWEEVFEFECTSSGESLEITVEDEDTLYNDFLGFVSILMGDLEDKRKMRQWYDLTLKTGDLPPGEERGAIEITTQWFYNPAFPGKGKAKKAENAIPNWLHAQTDSDTEEDEDSSTREVDPNAQIAKEDDPEETRKKQEEQDKLLAKLRDFKVVSGDYVAYVHIIEVRELKGEDLQGTSDPVVYVEAFGKKFATEVVKDRLNAVFDETFVINLRNMDQDDFKEGVFRISVMDADVTIGSLGSLKADLIGAASFDATYIYFHKDHEMHRRWVALVDDENPEDVGIQGYLHLSIAIIGPGDRLKVHDEEEDRRRERAVEAGAGGMDSLVVMPPAIQLQQKWLVTTVAKAEYLPVMDSNFGGGSGGGDYFFQVEVAGGKPLRTKKRSITGERHRLNPEWRNELWQPVTTPCMSGNVKFSVWDWDAVGQNELVGVFYGKLREIERSMKRPQSTRAPKWVNLYGPPLKIPETRNLKVLTKKAATLGLSSQTDYLNQYLNFPDRASTYRGRVLVTQRIVERAPPAHDREKTAWRRKIKAPPVPKAAPYVLRIFVGSGTEIPQFKDVAHFGKNKKMWIRVSVGRHELSTEPVDNIKGICEWYQSLQLKANFNLPADLEQVPDLMIHLMAGTGTNAEPCSFVRFRAKDLIDEQFGGKPKWIRLEEDKVLDLLVENEFPGSVLVRMGLGTVESYKTNKRKWKDEIQGLLKREPYELRVHLYQARNLPAADSSGLIDPYLKIKFGGEVFNTENDKELRRRQTVDPVWYYTARFNTMLPPKEYQQYFPQIAIQLFDYDAGLPDDFAGNLFLNLQDTEIILADRRTKSIPNPPTPTWESFFMETPGDAQGELLVSVQLIHTQSAELPKPKSIAPKTRTAHLDMVIVGIRDMHAYKYLPIQLPYCVFEVDTMEGKKKTVLTDTSNKPTGRDANFLQRIKMPLELPLEEIYAPRVKIRVYDTRLGGFNVPLVGSGRIELGKKLPWTSGYEAPLAKTFAKDELLKAVTGDGNDSDDGRGGDGLQSGAGSVRSGRSGASNRGGGFRFGSADFGSEEDYNSSGEFEEVGGGRSGFGGAAFSAPSGRSGFSTGAFGGSGRSGLGRSSVERTSKRVFGAATTPVNGAGVMGIFGSGRSFAGGESVDNAPNVNASGKVIDTGVGIIPALEVAYQEAGLTLGSRATTPVGAGGVVAGGAGRGPSQNPGLRGTALSSRLVEEVMTDAARSVAGKMAEDGVYSEEPDYMVGRKVLECSLEEELEWTPFETYDLFRGQVLGAVGGGSTLKKVGKLKCIVRVTEGDPDEEPLFADKRNFRTLAEAKAKNDTVMGELLKPRGYKLRLYCLQALNLTPMDIGVGGRPGKSDPYLRVRVGKEKFNDKENYIDDTTKADFYKCVELNCTLPGASQLEVEVMDYDDIGRDDLIGKTTIDLEDRWFDARWQALGKQNRLEGSEGPRRFETKPIESRTLLVPTSLAPQGQLMCWLDIMSPADEKAFKKDDISLPPNIDFEVRVVFWKCKDVVSMDTALDQNDLFIRSWVEGCDAQETDTHWFAKKGKGSFNWRMKFKVSLGPRTRTWKFPYLTIQLWDRDVFKWNDHIAEGQLDLGKYFVQAYHTRDRVTLFPNVHPKLKEEMLRADMGNMDVDAALRDDDAAERLFAGMESGPAEYDPERSAPPPYGAQFGQSNPSADSTVVAGVNNMYQGSPVPNGNGGSATAQAPAAAGGTGPAGSIQRKGKKKGLGYCDLLCPCCCGSGVGKGGTARTAPGDSEDEGDEAAADAKAFVSQVKNLTGLWDDDPDESYWLNMERTNFATGRKEQMGKVLLGVQIWPMEKAEALPVGNGRNDPNTEPFLPPPAGRVRFSLNPFVMGSELLGPKVCAKLTCVCCCIIWIFLLVYFSGFFNLLFSLALSIFRS